MGGILSTDEKVSRQNFHEHFSKKQIRRIVSLNDINGCQRTDNSWTRQRHHKSRESRNSPLHNRHDIGIGLPQKSQSLDTIFEEFSKDEINDTGGETKEDIPLKLYKPLIPRIKLNTKDRVKTNRNANRSTVMSTKPDSSESWNKLPVQNDTERIIENNQSSIITDEEISKKPDENYFTKNFDECMKRLHLLEKEHETFFMEKDGSNLFYLQKENRENADSEREYNRTPSDDVANMEQEKVSRVQNDTEKADENLEGVSEFEQPPRESLDEKFPENWKDSEYVEETQPWQAADEKHESNIDENRELISKWYTNLKQQFERNDDETKKEKTKEMSCRITGATLKNTNERVKVDDVETDSRHYFSKLVKSNRNLIDEELPDPNLVKNIRAKFQENLNSTLKRRLNNKLGGSLQNITCGKVQSQVWRPLSAQCNRDDIIREIQVNSTSEEKEKIPEDFVDSIKESGKNHYSSKLKPGKRWEKDLKFSKDARIGKVFPYKWTDSGSISSGVSSDLSSYDTDLESYCKEEPEPEPYDTITVYDDDLLDEAKDKHYVQSEILEKIRSFGTSVTYYGGEMITCSVGPLLSPTTQAIMEEITEKYRHEKNITRTFEEFYRKYFEVYDSSKKKKLGRTRSFGQSDVFHRPSTLNNTEIEMYKYDLEMEIGIRKPKGLPQFQSKENATKSNITEHSAQINEKDTGNETKKGSEIIESDSDKDSHQHCCPVTIVIEESAERIQQESPGGNGPRENDQFVSSNVEESNDQMQNTSTSAETSDRKLPFERSQSTPHEMTNYMPESDHDKNPFKTSSTEILFGYDKKLFNDGKTSDIEFEEFQVCDSAFEKIRRLSETSSRDEIDTREEIMYRHRKTYPEESTQFNHNEENNNMANKENLTFSLNTVQSHYEHNEREGNDLPGISGKPKKKNSNMRWPIETRGVVDIQKNSQSPGLVVCNGKSPNKSKIRFF